MKLSKSLLAMSILVGVLAAPISLISPVKAVEGVVIPSHTGYLDSYGYHVVGEVQNVGDQAVNFVKVKVTFYDSSDVVIATRFDLTMLSVLLVGEKSPFHIALLDTKQSAKVDHYSLSITFSTTDTLPMGLEILTHSSYVDEGYMHIIGEIKNIATEKALFVKVIATYYDEAGGVIAATLTYLDPFESELDPGQTAPFEILLSDERTPYAYTYELTAESINLSIKYVTGGEVREPPNLPPVVSDPSPFDGAEGVTVDLSTLSFDISDPESELMDYYVATDPDVGSGEGFDQGGGRYSIPLSGPLSYSTTYKWWVDVTDGSSWTNVTYTFTTEPKPEPKPEPPVVSGPSPPDGATGVPISLLELSFNLTDPNGDLMSYTVTSHVGSGTGNNVPNGRYTVPVSGLEYETTYTWQVDVTDGSSWTNVTYTFTTEPKPEPKPEPPVVSGPSPPDGATDVSTSLSELGFSLEDPDGDLMDYYVTTDPNVGGDSAIDKGDGRYAVSVSGLNPGETYTWHVNVTDSVHWTNVTYSFFTVAHMETYGFKVMCEDTTYYVTILSNSSVSSFSFDQTQKSISFDVTGPGGTRGACDVIFPKELLADPFEVTVDYRPIDFVLTQNATHNSLRFSYTQSTQTVRIIGTTTVVEPGTAMSEFYIWILIIVAIVAVTVSYLVWSRKKGTKK